MCAWDFPLPLGALKPPTVHLLGKFYSLSFHLNIILLPFSHFGISFPRRISLKKNLYEVPHFLVETTSAGKGNFFYYFNNIIIVVLVSILVQPVSLLAVRQCYVGLRFS